MQRVIINIRRDGRSNIIITSARAHAPIARTGAELGDKGLVIEENNTPFDNVLISRNCEMYFKIKC